MELAGSGVQGEVALRAAPQTAAAFFPLAQFQLQTQQAGSEVMGGRGWRRSDPTLLGAPGGAM